MKEKSSNPGSRSQAQIFRDMHRELRSYNPETPEAAERLDPIMRMMLEVYAHQVERVDKRLDQTWGIASSSLIKSVCPERGRRPIPAYTVIRCRPVDPVIDVDTHTRFFYKEKRTGGHTFFFSPECESRVIEAQTKKIYLCQNETVYDLSPPAEGEYLAEAPPLSTTASGQWQLYIAVDYSGPPSGLQGAVLFLTGVKEALSQMQWGRWYPSAQDSTFYSDSGFCPGLTGSIEDVLGGGSAGTDWGGLRTGRDLFVDLKESFVALPAQFTSTWELSRINNDLSHRCNDSGVSLPPEGESFYWIRIDVAERGDKKSFQQQQLGFYFDCLVATNKNELTLFKHTGANRLVEIEIPEKIDSILEIVSVVDSAGKDYRSLHDLDADPHRPVYVMEERQDNLVLWFDFSDLIDSPPDSITVTYAITAGTTANGIEVGRVSDLYESHPGIDSVENVIPVTGAIPARTQEQLLTEVSTRLRQRDRATTFRDMTAWTRTFDSRISAVKCRNGIERSGRGVRRCVIVSITIDPEKFFSQDEIELLRRRLIHFLKVRSTVNTQYVVEINRS